MPSEAGAVPASLSRARPPWLEGLVGQILALLTSLGIAVLFGSILIVAYGETPIGVYSSILEASLGTVDGIG
ncbi:MAG: hypothetical protein ACXWXS_08315, partial [Actinomycetota bacterium]